MMANGRFQIQSIVYQEPIPNCICSRDVTIQFFCVGAQLSCFSYNVSLCVHVRLCSWEAAGTAWLTVTLPAVNNAFPKLWISFPAVHTWHDSQKHISTGCLTVNCASYCIKYLLKCWQCCQELLPVPMLTEKHHSVQHCHCLWGIQAASSMNK